MNTDNIIPLPFRSANHLTAEENLRLLVEQAKELLPSAFPLVNSIMWGASSWPLGDTFLRNGKNAIPTVRWSLSRGGKWRNGVRGDDYPQPFANFAKAIFVHQHVANPRTYGSNWGLLFGLQYLYEALCERGAINISGVDAGDFERAAAIAKTRIGAGAAAQRGHALVEIARFVNSKNLTAVRFEWTNPNRWLDTNNRIGHQYDEARAKKLPDQETLESIAMAFRRAKEPIDVLVSSCLAVLCSAPSRVHELLKLPFHCEVEREIGGRKVYGLRWYPGKGANPQIKWVPTPMVDICRQAVCRLREVTAPARAVAEWYERNPRTLYLPSSLEHLREAPEQWRPARDFISILGASRESFFAWIRRSGLPKRQVGGLDHIRFIDLEAQILSDLPTGFPIAMNGFNYSELLLVTRQAESDTRRGSPITCMIAPFMLYTLFHRIGNSSRKNLFNRLGIRRADGSPVVLRSHQLRHWLNTIADRGKLSELEIAMWSGRKDVKQNQAYNQTSPEMKLAEYENLKKQTTPENCLAEYEQVEDKFHKFIVRAPVSREDFQRIENRPATHATQFGFCVHDYTTAPCQKHRDCTNCGEHCVIKGIPDREERIRRVLAITEEEVAKAEAEIADGTYGADRWLEWGRTTVGRLENLVEILDDPGVADGSVIMLKTDPALEYSSLRIAMERRQNQLPNRT